MKLTCLIEDTALSPSFAAEHGLSLYFEALGHKMLFDLGMTGLFLQNAAVLGVPVKEADIAVVSHGHRDHGGGLDAFLQVNHRARVYLRKDAFLPHYSCSGKDASPHAISLNVGLAAHPQLRFAGDSLALDRGITLFSAVKGRAFWSPANRVLLDENHLPDRFAHEQNLLLETEGKRILIAGCAHCGIVNIMERARKIAGHYPDIAVGGFHLMIPGNGETIPQKDIDALAERLRVYPTQYYTCHCTGRDGFTQLQKTLGERVKWLSAGSIVEL